MGRRMAAMIIGLLGVVLALALILSVARVFARDGGKWADASPDRKAWFDSLQNQNSTPCCSNADGVQLDAPEWRQTSDPDFPFDVFLEGAWVKVPKSSVVRATNIVGYAVVWPVHQPDGSPAVRCFMAGVQL